MPLRDWVALAEALREARGNRATHDLVRLAESAVAVDEDGVVVTVADRDRVVPDLGLGDEVFFLSAVTVAPINTRIGTPFVRGLPARVLFAAKLRQQLGAW